MYSEFGHKSIRAGITDRAAAGPGREARPCFSARRRLPWFAVAGRGRPRPAAEADKPRTTERNGSDETDFPSGYCGSGRGFFDRISGLLTLGVSFWQEEESLPTGETRFRVHCEQEDFLQKLRESVSCAAPEARCTLEALEAQDWLSAWRQFFTPVCCGSRFVVLPPWLVESPDFPGHHARSHRTKKRRLSRHGHHATTALCLGVVSGLLDQGRISSGQTFLDLGTGSGVLGIACCKSGLQRSGVGH